MGSLNHNLNMSTIILLLLVPLAVFSLPVSQEAISTTQQQETTTQQQETTTQQEQTTQQQETTTQQQTTTTLQPSRKGSHTWRGETFLLSWREDETSFTWDEARKYCSMKGMMMVSLDNPANREHLLQLVAEDGALYFWAGGEVSLDKTLLRWVNGMVEEIVRGDH